MPPLLKIGVLASGRGSNFLSILEQITQGRLQAQLCMLVSDREDAGALTLAQQNQIPHSCLKPPQQKSKKQLIDYENLLAERLKRQGVELVVLAGWMRMLGSNFLAHFPDRVINIHPSLLPAFPGLDAQKQAYDYGVKYTGCTVHFVDEGMDTGAIIAQQIVPVEQDDTVDTLRHRILMEEHLLYPRVIQLFVEDRIVKEGRKVFVRKRGSEV